ncbi:MAG: ATP-dependent helicase/nuclease subunit, partial [Moorella sp. (in: firmicutes)]|nr:ATP-dependent helicase/nuclease subunit [Moorella sp. (in: firmicutes)]
MGEYQKRSWTEEQLAAIQARQANLLVAAAAGAGKTAVLVERIIQRLTDPIAPISLENMLVVTFTEAAAAEMRQRIGAALEAAAARQPENEFLRRQLLLLNRAHISTIHSFCLWVVRTYFYRLDLDPGFKVMDPAEADLLQLEVMDQVLE